MIKTRDMLRRASPKRLRVLARVSYPSGIKRAFRLPKTQRLQTELSLVPSSSGDQQRTSLSLGRSQCKSRCRRSSRRSRNPNTSHSANRRTRPVRISAPETPSFQDGARRSTRDPIPRCGRVPRSRLSRHAHVREISRQRESESILEGVRPRAERRRLYGRLQRVRPTRDAISLLALPASLLTGPALARSLARSLAGIRVPTRALGSPGPLALDGKH